MITTYLDIKEKNINCNFDKLLVEIQMCHEKLVKFKTRSRKKDYAVEKNIKNKKNKKMR